MNAFRIILAVWLSIFSMASAVKGATVITATITVTNTAGVGTNWIVNANTRTWTNAAGTPPASWITTGASVGATASNLYSHIVRYPYLTPYLIPALSSTNVITLIGTTLSVTTNNYFSVSYVTNVGTNLSVVQVPFENVTWATNRTNNAHWLVDALNRFPYTNALATNANVLTNAFIKGAQPYQEILGPVGFRGRTAILSNFFATNGFTSAITNVNPVLSNAVVYGGLRSDGAGGNSFQAGSNAIAAGQFDLSLGNGAVSSNAYNVVIGTSAKGTNGSAVVIGYGAQAGQLSVAIGPTAGAPGINQVSIGSGIMDASASGGIGLFDGSSVMSAQYGIIIATASADVEGYSAIGIGRGVTANKSNSMAIGPIANAQHLNSAAIGPPDHTGIGVVTTSTNQIRLGTSNHRISAPGLYESPSATNSQFAGTNIARGSWSFPRFDLTTLAAGNNLAVPFGTNRYVRAGAGPASAATIVGIVGGATTGGLDGQDVLLFNDTGFSLVLAVNSVDPVPANRLNTQNGTDITIPDQASAGLHYDATDARWKVDWSGATNLTVNVTNAVASVMTNGVFVLGTGATNLDFVSGITGYVSGATVRLGVTFSGGVDGSANSNLSYAIGTASTNRENLFSAAITNALLGKVDEQNGVATNLTTYSGSAALTVVALPGIGTNSLQVMNTNAQAVVLVDSNMMVYMSNLTVRGVQTNKSSVFVEGITTANGQFVAYDTAQFLGTAQFESGISVITSAANISSGLNSSTVRATNGLLLMPATASRVAVFDASKQLTNSAAVDTTELEYLDGVTSAVQTQLNAKGTNYPAPRIAGATITVGSGVRQYVTLQTNTSFTFDFSGTPVNGEDIRFAVSNYSSSVLYCTNVAGIFDPIVASNVTTFAVAATSARWFHFVCSTNFNLGVARWEMVDEIGKKMELAVNGLNSFLAMSTNAAGSIASLSNTYIPQASSINSSNWSTITTNDMANIPAVTHLTNWSGAISNLAQTKQNGTAALTNISGLASTVFTNVPLGGTNIFVRTTAGTNFFDAVVPPESGIHVFTAATAGTNDAAITNITVDMRVKTTRLTLSNNATFTNWTGNTATTAGSFAVIIQPQLVNRTMTWPATSTAIYGLYFRTNSGSTLWTTLTNGVEYWLTGDRVDTNVVLTISAFQ